MLVEQPQEKLPLLLLFFSYNHKQFEIVKPFQKPDKYKSVMFLNWIRSWEKTDQEFDNSATKQCKATWGIV